MPEIDLDAAREFFERAAHAPLLQHCGEAIDDPNIETVKNWDQAVAAMQTRTWKNLINRSNNYFRHKTVARWGMPWYQSEFAKNCKAVDDLVPNELIEGISRARLASGAPDYAAEHVRRCLGQIAWEYAFAAAASAYFCRTYLESWVLSGHFPCGWKGRLPAEPRKLGVCDLPEVVGGGRLIVY